MRSMHIFVYIKWSQLRDFAFFQIPEVSGALAEVHKKLSTSNTYRVKDYSIYFKKLVTALKYLGKICGNESLTKYTPKTLNIGLKEGKSSFKCDRNYNFPPSDSLRFWICYKACSSECKTLRMIFDWFFERSDQDLMRLIIGFSHATA